MKTKLFYIFVAGMLLPCVGLREGVPAQTGKPTQGFVLGSSAQAVSYLPHLDFDLSNLDARDAQNRPISDSSLTQELYSLFTQNLFNLTVLADLHGMSQIWQDIESISHLLNSLFLHIAYPVGRAALDAIRPPEKRVVHNVDNLWRTFSVGNFVTLFAFAFFLTKRPFRHAVLRC